MKPDKKEISEENSNSKTNENEPVEISEQITETPKPDIDQQPTTQQPKTKEKTKPKKPKKVMHNYSELAPPADPIIEAPPPILDFNYIKPVNVSINEKYKASPEWERDLILWFTRLRPMLCKLEMLDNGKTNLQQVFDLIEANQLPQTNIFSNFFDSDKILFYFDEKTKRFTKFELTWIFASLISLDRLLDDPFVPCLTSILTKIIEQINELPSVEDPLYPYLMTVAIILQKFFHVA